MMKSNTSPSPNGPSVHSLACVSEDSLIGNGTRVWQYANVCRHSSVGENVSVGPYTNIDGAIVGNGTVISMWTSIPPGWEVGERCFIGPQVILVNDVWPMASKEGFDVSELISARTNKRIGIIDDEAVIGAQCTLLSGITIGKGAMVAAGTIVTQDVPPGKLMNRSGIITSIPDNIKERRLRYARS